MSVFNMLVLVITALVVKASSETVIQSCECSLCTCTAQTENGAQAATLTTAPTPEPTAVPTPEPTTAEVAAAGTTKMVPWTKYDRRKVLYKYYPKPILSFKEASQYCKNAKHGFGIRTHLVSIHSEGEFKYVQELVGRDPADVSILPYYTSLTLFEKGCRSNK